MGSESESENVAEKDTLYDFSLVNFIKRGRPSVTREMDIVPTKWIGFSKQKGRCTVKFPSSSSNPEDWNLLHDLVQALAVPPEDWKEYTVDIKGQAKTYDEALEKFERLKTQENCLSASDDGALKIQMAENVKRRQLQNDLEKMKANFASPNNTPNDNQNDSEESDAGISFELRVEYDTDNLSDNNQNKSTKDILSQTRYVSDAKNKSASGSINQGASTSTAPYNSDESFMNQYLNSERDKEVTLGKDTHLQDKDIHPPRAKKPRRDEPTASAQPASSDIASLPIIDLSHVDILSEKEFRMAVLSELIIIRKEVQGIRESQDQSSTYMLDKQVVQTKKTDLYRKYQLRVPFDDKKAFFEFNESLKTNRYLQNDICNLLKSLLDKDLVISKSYLNMIKQFMTKDLAMGFTASRKSRDKENPKDQLKPLQFFKLMEIVMTSAREEKKLTFTDKDSLSCLSDVLSNSKSWDRTKN